MVVTNTDYVKWIFHKEVKQMKHKRQLRCIKDYEED